MRLRLTIERQGLPPIQLLWSTASLVSTSNPPPSSASLSIQSSTSSSVKAENLTVAQLLDQINAVIPLESDTWGLEDYSLEVSGYECLHFAKVGDLLKEDDIITIRPLQTQEIRLRALGGRMQVSRDGRHLHDGVSWGKPFLRTGPRPEVRIAPRRNANLCNEKTDADEVENEHQLLLTNGTRQSFSTAPEHSNGYDLYDDKDTENGSYVLEQGTKSAVPFQNETSRSLRPPKRRLQSPFQIQRKAKRARSIPQMPILTGNIQHSRNSSLSSKIVRFDDQGAVSGETITPATIYDVSENSTNDEDDEDYEPNNSSNNPSSESTESDKENYDPETSSLEARRKARMTFVPQVELKNEPMGSTKNRSALTEVDSISSGSSHSEPGLGEVPALTGAEETSSDESTSSEGSDASSSESEDESDSGFSGYSKDSNTSSVSVNPKEKKVLPPVSQARSEFAVNRTSCYARPGQGKKETHRRNERKRRSTKLALLKERGILPHNASLSDLAEYQKNHISRDTSTSFKGREIEIGRQRLLDAIASGGIDVEATNTDGIKSKRVSVNPDSSSEASKTNLSPPKKRHRIDTNASRRLLFSGLGLRMPSEKTEEDNMRESSHTSSQAQVKRNCQRAHGEACKEDEPADIADPLVADEHWQEHIVLSAVECTDATIRYSTPPFPFEQRWDPKQATNVWNKVKAKRQKKKNLKRNYEADIEEHFDAAMYDEQPDTQEDVVASKAKILPSRASLADGFVTHEKKRKKLLGVFTSPDLALDQAVPGARVAFKTLELSEATGWMPAISEYKIATVTAIDGDILTLSLDNEFRPIKQTDPETGERIYSNFRVEDMDENDDESILEVKFTELRDAKLLGAASNSKETHMHCSELAAREGAALEVFPRAASAERATHSSQMIPNETALDTSFGASTYTAVEDVAESNSIKPTGPNGEPGFDAQRDTSLLIRQAGFRTSVDPEANRSLNTTANVNSSGQVMTLDRIESNQERDERVLASFSSSSARDPGDHIDIPTAIISDDRNSESGIDDSHPPASWDTSKHASLRNANGGHEETTSCTKAHVDNMRFSSTERSEPPATATVTSEWPNNDMYQVRRMMSGALPRETSPTTQSPSKSDNLPEGNPSGKGDDGKEKQSDGGDSQDSLPSLDAIFTSSRVPMNHTRNSNQKSLKTRSQEHTEQKNTRLKARRASAMANPITLSDDETTEANPKHAISSPFISTAPAAFRPINSKQYEQATSNSESGSGNQGKNNIGQPEAIDLTNFSSYDTASSDDDDHIEPLRDVSGREDDSGRPRISVQGTKPNPTNRSKPKPAMRARSEV